MGKGGMSKREFYGAEFYGFCQREYDKARQSSVHPL